MAIGVRGKGDPAITMLSVIFGRYHKYGDKDCVGDTALVYDIMFMNTAARGCPVKNAVDNCGVVMLRRLPRQVKHFAGLP